GAITAAGTIPDVFAVSAPVRIVRMVDSNKVQRLSIRRQNRVDLVVLRIYLWSKAYRCLRPYGVGQQNKEGQYSGSHCLLVLGYGCFSWFLSRPNTKFSPVRNAKCLRLFTYPFRLPCVAMAIGTRRRLSPTKYN